MIVSRRELISTGTVLALAGTGTARAAQALLDVSTSQEMGPFYPVMKPLDHDADLTIIRGRRAGALGQTMQLFGRVLDTTGRPIPHAELEIWQANAAGRYSHPKDDNPAPLDPNFQGYAHIRADAAGRYRIRSIKPGAYPSGPGAFRAPHIHFEITSKVQKRVTQMYFEREPLNEPDEIFSVLKRTGSEKSVIAHRVAALREYPNDLAFVWDIVMLG